MAGESKVVKIAPGVSVPQEVYGVKAAGYSQLVELQQQCPVPYLVPDAYAVPPLAHGGFSAADIRQAFNDLTSGLAQAAVLIARSSATDEMPGQNPTLFTYFNPKDVEGSFKRYAASVNEVLNTSSTMGVLLTKMVGDPVTLKGGKVVIGRNNVSFVADSHNPVNADEMTMSLVHGLGSKVVEAGNEAIIFTVDRDIGNITFVGEQRADAVLQRTNSTGIDDLQDYRQRSCDAFDVKSGAVVSRPIDEGVFANYAVYTPNVVHGMLTSDDIPPGPLQIEGLMYRQMYHTPFGNVGMFGQLAGALKYLSEQLGPVQIEGAFTSNDASAMHLYQVLSVPEPTRSNVPLTIQQPDLISKMVMGSGRVQMPLFYRSGYTSSSDLRAFDAQHATTGYALLAQSHDLELTGMSPNCRVRLSYKDENMSSHPVTLTRFKMLENPEAGYMLAMNVQNVQGAQVVKYGPHAMVTIESNGKELRMELPPTPEEVVMMKARALVSVAGRGTVQGLKGTGVTLAASVLAQVADAMVHNDWRGVQQMSAKGLALDGAAIFGSGAAIDVVGGAAFQTLPETIISEPMRTLGLSGLKLGAASAFLQLLHSNHISFAEAALNVGAGVAYQMVIGRALSVLDSIGLKATARFFAKTPGTLLLSATFMFAMEQVHRQKVASEIEPVLHKARAAVLELLQAEAKIQAAQRNGIEVEPEAIATVQRMMREYIQQLKKLPDVDEVMLYREHLHELAEIHRSAGDASMAAMSTMDPTSAMSQIDHNETVEIQSENRKFTARLVRLHDDLIRDGRELPALDESAEFLAEPLRDDLDEGTAASQSIDELLSCNFSGMAAQLQDYLKDSI